jgi:hypothetical protein
MSIAHNLAEGHSGGPASLISAVLCSATSLHRSCKDVHQWHCLSYRHGSQSGWLPVNVWTMPSGRRCFFCRYRNSWKFCTQAQWQVLIELLLLGAHGRVFGWGSMLQAGTSRDRVYMRWIFFNLPNISDRIMALGSTQPLIEMSTRNLSGDKRRPARRADNLTAICESTV